MSIQFKFTGQSAAETPRPPTELVNVVPAPLQLSTGIGTALKFQTKSISIGQSNLESIKKKKIRRIRRILEFPLGNVEEEDGPKRINEIILKEKKRKGFLF